MGWSALHLSIATIQISPFIKISLRRHRYAYVSVAVSASPLPFHTLFDLGWIYVEVVKRPAEKGLKAINLVQLHSAQLLKSLSRLFCNNFRSCTPPRYLTGHQGNIKGATTEYTNRSRTKLLQYSGVLELFGDGSLGRFFTKYIGM